VPERHEQTEGVVLKDFKAFLLRGNVVDRAIAVVIGAAFGMVVNALVKDIVTPIISIPGKSTFSDLHFTIRHSVFAYGDFFNQVIAFVSIAAAVFFFVVKPVNVLMERRKTEPDVDSTVRECPECLSKIPSAARRCAFCTAEVSPSAA
jgi:large conductance mechanosensitive channel